MDWLRRADWLTHERVRGYALLLVLASLVLAGVSFWRAMPPGTTDFLAFWGAGQLTAAGDPAAAYDLAAQQRVQSATGSSGWFAFVNPPPFLFVVAPLGVLPLPIAWAAWVALTWGLWCWVGIRAFPRLWPLVLAYPGALIAAGHAQTGLLTGALLVLAAQALSHRPRIAGAAIGALVIKPHLAVLAPFWLAAGGRWRAFAAAGLTAAGLLAAAWLTFGTATMLAYTDSWAASRQLVERLDPAFMLRMSTAFAQLRLLMGDGIALAGAGLSAALALAVALTGWRRAPGDTSAVAAAVLAATALASPYLFNYDLPFLVYPTLWLVLQGLERGFRPYEKLALVLLYFAPYATRAAAFPIGVNLMPLAALALLALIWTRAPTGTARQG